MTTSIEYRRKSQIATGISVISLFFLLETYQADRRLPNAASPYIWAVLGIIALTAGGLAVWFRVRAGKT
jgi:hypothetical protein